MKRTIRFYLAMATAKAMIVLMRLLGRSATNLPGEVALAICPDFLGQLQKPHTIIGVTGTNGKTTVTNMIADVLADNGYVFAGNRAGGNVDTGITTALIRESTLSGKTRKKLAVLEIDERSANRIYPHLQPTFLVCTNLFRDSAKRNAHPEFISHILNTYIPASTRLILNGDDLISGRLAPGNARVYFGIDHLEGEVPITDNLIKDVVACPVCDHPLKYDFVRYNHIGRAHCPHCGFGSPAVDYAVTAVDRENRLVHMRTPAGEETYHLAGDNITDLYNMTAAIALLREFGLTCEQIEASYQKIKIVETRFHEEKVGGRTIVDMLAKGQNPIACSRVFDFVRKTPGQKAVILVIDDVHDSLKSTENTSWIYECDFEFLRDESVRQIVVGGKRAWDFQLRLLMAGVPKERIACCQQERETPRLLRLDGVDTVFLLHDICNNAMAQQIKQELRGLCAKGEEPA